MSHILTLAFGFGASEWLSRFIVWALDVTGMAECQISPTDRKSWKECIWDQYNGFLPLSSNCRIWGCRFFFCAHKSPLVLITEGGFHPGPFVNVSGGDTAHARLFPRPTLAPLRGSDNDHIY
jgi:hypothetical protein